LNAQALSAIYCPQRMAEMEINSREYHDFTSGRSTFKIRPSALGVGDPTRTAFLD